MHDIGNNGTAGGNYRSGGIYMYTGDVTVSNDQGNTQTVDPGHIYFGTGRVNRTAGGVQPNGGGPNPDWRMIIKNNGSRKNKTIITPPIVFTIRFRVLPNRGLLTLL